MHYFGKAFTAGHEIAWEFAGKYPDRLHTLIPISVPHPEAFAMR